MFGTSFKTFLGGGLNLPVYLTLSLVPKVMEVDLTVSSRVLKQGEVLTVNCTVKDTEMVYFFWDFPRKQVPASLPPPTLDFLSRASLIFY